MRVEVDLSNPQHVLRDGMYGRAEIILEKSTSNLTVPSSAMLDRDSKGKGLVEVVRDGKMYRQAVKVGRDTGTVAEIISGLSPDAQVIVQPDVAMADGTPVEVESGAVAEGPAKHRRRSIPDPMPDEAARANAVEGSRVPNRRATARRPLRTASVIREGH